ncbi:MAG: hypothetical protein WC722_01485 [Rhodospirillales bacterium]|jgi:hypothetical protein
MSDEKTECCVGVVVCDGGQGYMKYDNSYKTLIDKTELERFSVNQLKKFQETERKLFFRLKENQGNRKNRFAVDLRVDNHDFIINVAKGDFAGIIVSSLLKAAGYSVVPYGYESHLFGTVDSLSIQYDETSHLAQQRPQL